MSSRFKRPKKLTNHPLPKRNRKEAMLRQIAGTLRNETALARCLLQQPEEIRVDLLNQLRHHLPFSLPADWVIPESA